MYFLLIIKDHELGRHKQSYKREPGGSETEEQLCDKGSKRLSDAKKGTQVAPRKLIDKE